ncbi:MAG: tetratricopeptide repeat protein [Gammaproteobacteria bacterium]|nr:tetratricopeptide repeat protein [Gammaproteobacteria bacterium]
MSLINDMLKDLENRPRKLMAKESMLDDLKNTFTYELKSNKKYYLTIGVLVVVLIGIGLFVSLRKHYQSVQANLSVVVNKNVIQKPAVTAAIQNSTITMLTGVALQMQKDMTYLRFLLSQNTLYRLDTNEDLHQLTIIFDRTQLLAALPKVNYAGSGIEDIQAYKDENDNLKIVLQLNPNTDIKRLALDQSSTAPELQLDLLYKNINVTAENTTLPKTSIPVSIKRPVVESAVQEHYQHAQKLSAAGLYDEAITSLRELVSSVPTHFEARELLATLLIKKNNLQEANQIIDEGMQQQPVYPIFAELKAQLFLKENKVDNAIQVLEKYSPAIQENPKYYTLIATLYQRQGKANLAASLYKQLLSLDPKNSKLWLGYGVSQESLGHSNIAVEAFNNADSIGDLTPELKAYVDTQLHKNEL